MPRCRAHGLDIAVNNVATVQIGEALAYTMKLSMELIKWLPVNRWAYEVQSVNTREPS